MIRTRFSARSVREIGLVCQAKVNLMMLWGRLAGLNVVLETSRHLKRPENYRETPYNLNERESLTEKWYFQTLFLFQY